MTPLPPQFSITKAEIPVTSFSSLLMRMPHFLYPSVLYHRFPIHRDTDMQATRACDLLRFTQRTDQRHRRFKEMQTEASRDSANRRTVCFLFLSFFLQDRHHIFLFSSLLFHSASSFTRSKCGQTERQTARGKERTGASLSK